MRNCSSYLYLSSILDFNATFSCFFYSIIYYSSGSLGVVVVLSSTTRAVCTAAWVSDPINPVFTLVFTLSNLVEFKNLFYSSVPSLFCSTTSLTSLSLSSSAIYYYFLPVCAHPAKVVKYSSNVGSSWRERSTVWLLEWVLCESLFSGIGESGWAGSPSIEIFKLPSDPHPIPSMFVSI